MATEVDICNVALARIGDEATLTGIDPDEGSPQAEHCERFFPMCLNVMLESYPWRFALTRANLAALKKANENELFNRFVVPSDCRKIVNVYDASLAMNTLGTKLVPDMPYSVEMYQGQRVIICNAEDICLRYITSNTPVSLFPSDFCDALAWLLASYLAGAIIPGTNGAKMAQAMKEFYESALAVARSNDSRQSNEWFDFNSGVNGDFCPSRLHTSGDFYGD